MKTFYLFIFTIVLSTVFFNCKKSSNNSGAKGLTPVKVHLGDAPASVLIDEVNIEVTGVEFKMENGTAIDLNVHPGVINLLDFVNGKRYITGQ